ncbi:MAG: hypothetical protein R3C01_01225 [Planctomycetaceae bacterium]
MSVHRYSVSETSKSFEETSRDPLGLYVESLDICRQIVSRFGESPQSLRDVSISLEKVADAMRGLGVGEVAIDGVSRDPLGLYVESLDTRRQIVSRFGESPESLRDVSASLQRIGDFEVVRGNRQQGLDAYLELLSITRRILDSYGDSPDSFRIVSISLNKVADAMRGLGVGEVAIDGVSRDPLGLYVDSLDIRRQIVRRFGESPQSLRDVFVSLSRMTFMAREEGDVAKARAYLREARDILEQMLYRGWDSPQMQQELAWVTGQEAEIDDQE